MIVLILFACVFDRGNPQRQGTQSQSHIELTRYALKDNHANLNNHIKSNLPLHSGLQSPA